jgi:hypothetical protein
MAVIAALHPEILGALNGRENDPIYGQYEIDPIHRSIPNDDLPII